MKNEMTNTFEVIEGVEIEDAELKAIAAALPVRTTVRAGNMPGHCEPDTQRR